MIIDKPSLCTHMNIWSPRYSSKYGEAQEWVALLSQYTVHHASSTIIVEFTKAKHLKGQRFAITRDKIQKCAVDSNGKIPCYAVPMSMFETWDTPAEVKTITLELFPD